MSAGVLAFSTFRQGCSTQIVGSSSFCSSQAALPLLTSHRRSLEKRTFIVSASQNDNDDAATDWDTAWSTFRKGVEAQSPPTRKSNVGTKPPTFSNGTSSSGGWNAGRSQNDIRKQESTLLDLWTKESFSQLSIVAIVLLFIALVVAGGEMPHDDRCTLPWC